MLFWKGKKPILKNVVSYTLKVPVAGEKNIRLEFQNTYQKVNSGAGMESFSYSFNGRTYQDVKSLRLDPKEDISENVQITTDAYGEKVLKTYTQIPTFDSSDREWDSKELEYLMFDGKQVHLVVMRGGYRIAKLTFYEKLLSADIRIKPIFKKLGWPVSGITWR